jgi:hypothetical protein
MLTSPSGLHSLNIVPKSPLTKTEMQLWFEICKGNSAGLYSWDINFDALRSGGPHENHAVATVGGASP